MTYLKASSVESEDASINWAWFLTGCVSLAIGSVYIHSADLESDFERDRLGAESSGIEPVVEQIADENVNTQRL